jgi:dihydrofolate reductase
MRSVSVFNAVSLDGYFTDARSDMSWAHRSDPEWVEYTSDNAKGGQAMLLFGRKTYQMMAGFWPTPEAEEQMPEVAAGINGAPKMVFSRTLREATWNNTTLVDEDPVAIIRRLKQARGPDMLLMGSGTIIALLAGAGLVDRLQLVVTPIVLGAGRTMFEGVRERLDWKLTGSRRFENGNVVLDYERG